MVARIACTIDTHAPTSMAMMSATPTITMALTLPLGPTVAPFGAGRPTSEACAQTRAPPRPLHSLRKSTTAAIDVN